MTHFLSLFGFRRLDVYQTSRVITHVVLAMRHLMVLNRLEIGLVLLMLRHMRRMLRDLKAHLVRQPLDYLSSSALLLKRLLSLRPRMIEIDTRFPHRGLDRLSLVCKLPRLVDFLGLTIVVDLLLVACCLLKEPVTGLAQGLLEGRVLVYQIFDCASLLYLISIDFWCS